MKKETLKIGLLGRTRLMKSLQNRVRKEESQLPLSIELLTSAFTSLNNRLLFLRF